MYEITSITPEFAVKDIPPPIDISADTIFRLNASGMREQYEPLKIIDECRDAMREMPKTKIGLVLGTGDNTQEWRHKGWVTLDIDPSFSADFTLDANELLTEIPPESLDYICAEAIRMDPNGTNGVSPSRLLHQANAALKPGGKLIVITANVMGYDETTLPEKSEYAHLLQRHGFQGVIELHPRNFHEGSTNHFDQKVIYYGVKKRSGYSRDD